MLRWKKLLVTALLGLICAVTVAVLPAAARRSTWPHELFVDHSRKLQWNQRESTGELSVRIINLGALEVDEAFLLHAFEHCNFGPDLGELPAEERRYPFREVAVTPSTLLTSRFPITRGSASFGWPMPMLMADWYLWSDNQWSVSSGVLMDTPPSTPANDIRPRLIPARPLWLGIGLCVLFWGVVLWSVEFFVRVAIATVRSRRGRCWGCGYPKNTYSVCTECGRCRDSGTIQTLRAVLAE